MEEQRYQRLDDILQSLRSQPTLQTLANALDDLDRVSDGFNIREPGPKASLLISALVGPILSDFWSSLKPSDSQERDDALFLADVRLHFLNCLRGANGLGALEARLRTLMPSQRDYPEISIELPRTRVVDLLEVLTELLDGDTFLWSTWSSIRRTTPISKTAPLQLRGLLKLLCGGRLHSTAAEADSPRIRIDGDSAPSFWISDRSQYWGWVGRNIVHMSVALEIQDVAGWHAVAKVLDRSLRFGYQSHVVEEVYWGLVVQTCHLEKLHHLVKYASVFHKRQFLDSILHILYQKLAPQSESAYAHAPRTAQDSRSIAAAAATVSGTVGKCEKLKEGLVNWLLAQVRGLDPGPPLLEAVIAVLAPDEECVRSLLKKNVKLFGAKLFIKRASMSSHKVNAQILLLLAGCLHRSNEQALDSIAGSSDYLNAISNRLAASRSTCRFLGMVVGSAVSALVDSSDKRLKFEFEAGELAAVRWYTSLTRVPFVVGSLDDIKTLSTLRPPPQTQQPRQHHQPTKRPTKRPETAKREQPPKVQLIEEVTDCGAHVDGRFVPHDKPDSDKEDSDEDPTLVARERPTAPVYVRELIKALQDSENYDRQQLALAAAAGLIRRKAEYGTEVSDHAYELAGILTGLQDKFDMENFQEQRLRAMIALVNALPTRMGPWFVNAFFAGDYSVSQRLSMLSAIGLGARRIAGFQAEDDAITGTEAGAVDAFPSKKLPETLHNIYSDQSSPMRLLAQRLGRTMALAGSVEAEDSPVGPTALKIQKVTTRMGIEKKRKPPVKSALAGIVGGAFFYPLVGGWWVQMKALGTNGFFMSTDILPAYLKTVSIILHASGPATASLPDLTSEFWDLLMSIPSSPSYDSVVIEGLLFGFLTILDVNEDHRRLVEEQPREVVETQKWASKIFDDTAGDDPEDERIKMLAASILVRISDMMDKYQALLLGNLT